MVGEDGRIQVYSGEKRGVYTVVDFILDETDREIGPGCEQRKELWSEYYCFAV